MSDEQFPALRFDPAKGNVGTVQNLAKQMHDTGVYAKTALDTVDGIKNDSEVWTGKAAHGFTDKLGELPKYLDKAHQSLQKAGKALNTWTDQLQQHQQRARELEKQAKQAIAQAERADSDTDQAKSQAENPQHNNDLNDHAAQQRARDDAEAVTRAQNSANQAWGKVEDIRRKAQQLQERWEDDGKTCAKALNDAGAIAPDKSLWEHIGDAFKWLGEHIGEIASVISAIAGVLSFIPGINAIAAPIALAAGAVALGADATKMATHPENLSDPNAWINLGGDVLGVVPGVGPAMKGMSEGVGSMTRTVGLTKAAGSGLQEFGSEAATALSKPSKVFEKIGDKTAENFGGNADTIAKSADIGTKVIGGGGAAANLGGDQQRLADTTGAVNQAATSAGTISGAGENMKEISDGASELGASLSKFTRALG